MSKARLSWVVLFVPLAYGCATTAQYTTVSPHLSVVAPRGFQVAYPVVRAVEASTEFRGSVCRRALGRMSPRVVRAEKLDSAGESQASQSAALIGLGARLGDCTFYTVTAAWRLTASDSVRICALTADGPCHAPLSRTPE